MSSWTTGQAPAFAWPRTSTTPSPRWQLLSTPCASSPDVRRTFPANQATDGSGTMTIRRIAVLGAGTMGHGIAHASISAGFETSLYDVAAPSLERAGAAIRNVVAHGVQLRKLKTGDAASMLEKLSATTSLGDALDGADFVIEAAPEQIDV